MGWIYILVWSDLNLILKRWIKYHLIDFHRTSILSSFSRKPDTCVQSKTLLIRIQIHFRQSYSNPRINRKKHTYKARIHPARKKDAVFLNRLSTTPRVCFSLPETKKTNFTGGLPRAARTKTPRLTDARLTYTHIYSQCNEWNEALKRHTIVSSPAIVFARVL